MAKYNFNLRNPDSKDETAIHLVIRWNNQRLVFPTKEHIAPKFWELDPKKKNFQRAIETRQFPEYPEFNARLNNIETDAKDVFRKFENDNDHRQPTIEELRELLKKKFNPADSSTTTPADFFSFVDKFIKESPNRTNPTTGKPLSGAIVKAYKNTLHHLLAYQQARRKKVNFDNIDLDFYHDFTEYLAKTQKFTTNTIGKHIKTIKVFLNEATERGVNTNTAFRSKRFRVLSEETESIYLNEAELEELYTLDLSSKPRLERVRDLFIVGCWTGLRFSDFSNISSESIGDEFIEIRTKKTGEMVLIPIHPTVRAIMQKYEGLTANSLPRALSNVKMNAYLKELGQLVSSLHELVSISITKGGVQLVKTYKKYELIGTHTARRCFATNLYLAGVPILTIMKITGHRTEKAFMRYIKITPDQHAKILQLHWQNKHMLRAV